MIKRFEERDINRYKEILESCMWQEVNLNIPKPLANFYKRSTLDFIFSDKFIESLLSEPSFVHVHDDIVNGFCKVEANEIFALYIDPKYKKRGHGSILLEFMEESLMNEGNDKCILRANFGSIGFYEKKGYRMSDGEPKKNLFKRILKPYIVMQKTLNY